MQLLTQNGTLDLDHARFLPASGEAAVRLTTREVGLLRHLADHLGEDVSRDELLSVVWGYHELSMSRAVDTTVSRLRRKIEVDPRTPETLCTSHGEGYRLVLASPAVTAVEPVAEDARVLRLGGRTVDLTAGLVRVGSDAVQLTCQERRLLVALADRPGIVVGPGKLARLAGVVGGRAALTNAVYRVRSKVESDPSKPRWIVGVRRQGYRLDLPVVPSPAGTLRETVWGVAEYVGQVLGLDDCGMYLREA
jgi:DNA-binding response OmpR family regulator